MRRQWIIFALLSLLVAGCGQTTQRPKDVLSKPQYQQLIRSDRSVREMKNLNQVISSCQNLTRSRYAQCLHKGLQSQVKIIGAAAATYAQAAKSIQGGCHQELAQESHILRQIASRLHAIASSIIQKDSQKFTRALKALKQDVERIRKTEHSFSCKHQL